MTTHEPRPLTGDELDAVTWDSYQHPCRICRAMPPDTFVCLCYVCLQPLCYSCHCRHFVRVGEDHFTCTGRSFRDA